MSTDTTDTTPGVPLLIVTAMLLWGSHAAFAQVTFAVETSRTKASEPPNVSMRGAK